MRAIRALANIVRPPRLGPDSVVSGSMLATKPPILLLKPRPRPFGPAFHLAARYPDAPLVFLRQLTWHYEDWASAAVLAAQHLSFRTRHPRARLIILANTENAARKLSRLGVDVLFASSNMFLDERLFYPLPDRPKLYDAIYNAQLNPYKRHHLAREIGNCAYITYLPTFQNAAVRRKRMTAFLASLPDGQTVLNERLADNFRMMYAEEINEAMNASHVGLCLSKREGQMYASVEYLLAGIPVVSTENQGGRDVYLHPELSITVRDDPRAIRDAVAALKARAIPAHVVRETTLGLIQRDRDRFNRFIEELCHGQREGDDPRWSFRYVHKLVVHTPLPEVETAIGEALRR